MLSIGTILWAKSNSAHYDHIHVEPAGRMSGTPPTTNPGMTDGVRAIYDALEARFGKGAYFADASQAKTADWTHMGGWNRRYIAGTTTWSQHAWWNALDIGPLYGVDEQREFYDYLVGLRDGTIDPAEVTMTSPTFKGAQDIGAQAGVDPGLQAAWDRAQAFGVATANTLPDDISTAEQTVAYIDRYHSKVVVPLLANLEARIARLEALPTSGGLQRGDAVKLV